MLPGMFGVSSLSWFAATVKKVPSHSQVLEQQVQSLFYQVLKWMNVPKEYTGLAEWGLRIGVALFIFFVFAVLARRSRIRSIVDWLDRKVGIIELTPADRSFFSFLAWVGIWLPGLILVLYVLRLGGLLATVGISAGAVAAIAATANRELLGNVFAGFALQARRQITPGDAVKIKGLSGTIKSIGLTSSELQDYEGIMHFIPNSSLLNEVLTNYSLAPYRRAEIAFFFDIDEVAIEEVEDILGEILEEAPGQAAHKPGFFRYGVLTEKGQEVKLYVYFKPQDWSKHASETRRLLLDKIHDSAVQLGVPQQLMLHVEDEETGA